MTIRASIRKCIGCNNPLAITERVGCANCRQKAVERALRRQQCRATQGGATAGITSISSPPPEPPRQPSRWEALAKKREYFADCDDVLEAFQEGDLLRFVRGPELTTEERQRLSARLTHLLAPQLARKAKEKATTGKASSAGTGKRTKKPARQIGQVVDNQQPAAE